MSTRLTVPALPARPFVRIATLLAASLLLVACGGNDEPEEEAAPPVPETLKKNQLGGAPSTFLANAESSPIHWQRWNPGVLETAREADRPLFVVAGSARYPGCFETIRALERKPALVRRLNEEFVPVLADIEICREVSLLASSLSAKAEQAVSFPFIFLVSPEGAPISWQPLLYRDDAIVYEFFENSVDVVSRLWNESRSYVKDDSRRKLENFQEAKYQKLPIIEETEQRSELFRVAVRRLNSFYDEDVSTLFGSGGLFPHGLLETFALAAVHPTLPESLRDDCRASLDGLLDSLVTSSMIDPLDGGIYSSRLSESWDTPSRLRDCTTQARVIRVFAQIASLGLNEDALPVALGTVRFAEDRFQLETGLFSVSGVPGRSPDEEWMWSLEEIQAALNDDEAKFWIELSEIGELGNLPSEADPTRRYFRRNALALRHTPAEAATRAGLDPGRAKALLDSGRPKLLAARESRFPYPERDLTPSASASFQMISAYAALFAATGDDAWLAKATALGDRCREAFGASRFLNERPGENPEEMSDGRAFTYALAVQAALDLGAVTLDPAWNLWAQDLTTLLGENFVTEEGKLTEARPEVRVIPITYEDRTMVYSESTAGLLANNLSRLRALDFQVPPNLQPRIHSLPAIHRRPIIHTDFLRALGVGLARRTVEVASDSPPELRRVVTTRPLGLVARRLSDAIDAGARVVSPGGEAQTTDSPAELEAWLQIP